MFINKKKLELIQTILNNVLNVIIKQEALINKLVDRIKLLEKYLGVEYFSEEIVNKEGYRKIKGRKLNNKINK